MKLNLGGTFLIVRGRGVFLTPSPPVHHPSIILILG